MADRLRRSGPRHRRIRAHRNSSSQDLRGNSFRDLQSNSTRGHHNSNLRGLNPFRQRGNCRPTVHLDRPMAAYRSSRTRLASSAQPAALVPLRSACSRKRGRRIQAPQRIRVAQPHGLLPRRCNPLPVADLRTAPRSLPLQRGRPTCIPAQRHPAIWVHG